MRNQTKMTSPWFIFTLVAIAQFMVVLDVAITNVALPSIQSELGFSSALLPWVIAAYALSFGGFLIFGGRAADLFGRRKILIAGMIAFTTFSLLIGLSTRPLELVILRMLQGTSAAFMSPSALSIVLVTFRDGIKRSTALAYWALIASGGAGAGLLIGGLLTQYLGWQWNFFVNVPIGIIMSILIYRFVPLHEKEERNSGMDVSGALLITVSLMSVALGLSVAPLWGWGSMGTIGLFLFAAVTLGGFIWNEKHVRSPLIPLSIFRTRNLTGANLIMIPLYATVLGAFFLLSVFLQDHLSYRPLITGLAFLPFPIAIGFTSTRMPKLIAKYCYRPFLIGGPILVLAAYLWFTRMPLDASYLVDLLPAFLVMPIGVGLAMTPTYTAATSGVPDHETGLASGLITTSQQMGGALGLSALASIAASAGTVSFIHGYHVAFFAGTGFMVLAIAVAFFVIRNRCDEGTATEAGAML